MKEILATIFFAAAFIASTIWGIIDPHNASVTATAFSGFIFGILLAMNFSGLFTGIRKKTK